MMIIKVFCVIRLGLSPQVVQVKQVIMNQIVSSKITMMKILRKRNLMTMMKKKKTINKIKIKLKFIKLMSKMKMIIRHTQQRKTRRINRLQNHLR